MFCQYTGASRVLQPSSFNCGHVLSSTDGHALLFQSCAPNTIKGLPSTRKLYAPFAFLTIDGICLFVPFCAETSQQYRQTNNAITNRNNFMRYYFIRRLLCIVSL